MSWLNEVRARIRHHHPDHAKIAKSMAWITLFVLLGAIAHAGREMLIAYHFGAGATADAYIFLFNLLKWPAGIWLSVLTVVLIPLASHSEQDTTIKRFRAELLGFSLILGSGLTALALVGLPLLAQSTVIGFPDSTAAIAISMSSSLAVLAILGIVIGTLSAWSMTTGHHMNTLLEATPPTILVLFLMCGSKIEPDLLISGTIIGVVVHLVLLAVSLAARKRLDPPKFTLHSPQWPAFRQGIGIMVAGQVLLGMTTLADQIVAATLSTGTVSALNYATRLHALALGIGTIAISRATLPIFSKYHDADYLNLQKVALDWSKLLFLIGLIAAAIGWLIAPSLVKIFFERGAFSATDTDNVATLFRYGLPQLPFYFSALLFISYLSSRRLYVWIFWSGVIGLLTKLIGNVLLTATYGAAGITLATSCMYAANFIFFLLAFKIAAK